MGNCRNCTTRSCVALPLTPQGLSDLLQGEGCWILGFGGKKVALSRGSPHPGGLGPWVPPQGPDLPLGGRSLLSSSLGLAWARLWLRRLGVCPSPGHPSRHPASSPGSQSGAPDSPWDPGLVPRLGERVGFQPSPSSWPAGRGAGCILSY